MEIDLELTPGCQLPVFEAPTSLVIGIFSLQMAGGWWLVDG